MNGASPHFATRIARRHCPIMVFIAKSGANTDVVEATSSGLRDNVKKIIRKAVRNGERCGIRNAKRVMLRLAVVCANLPVRKVGKTSEFLVKNQTMPDK